jgi:hypothetical protein
MRICAKGPAGLAPYLDLTLESPAIHFRHETGDRQGGTRLRHTVAGVNVEPMLQRFSGERLRQNRAANEHPPARKIDARRLGTVQQHPQDGWHAVRKSHFFALKECNDRVGHIPPAIDLF